MRLFFLYNPNHFSLFCLFAYPLHSIPSPHPSCPLKPTCTKYQRLPSSKLPPHHAFLPRYLNPYGPLSAPLNKTESSFPSYIRDSLHNSKHNSSLFQTSKDHISITILSNNPTSHHQRCIMHFPLSRPFSPTFPLANNPIAIGKRPG
jgi:hypothetical protein